MSDRDWDYSIQGFAGEKPEAGAGWKMVPIEPTAHMKRVANSRIAITTPDGTWALALDEAEATYKAMLAAAPPRPEDGAKAGRVSSVAGREASAERIRVDRQKMYDEGRSEERAAIVAWLRTRPPVALYPAHNLAAAIEASSHKGGEQT